MKTPLEAIDEAILHLQSIRDIFSKEEVVLASSPFSASTAPLMIHIYRPAEDSKNRKNPERLAKALGGYWIKGVTSATWENAPAQFPEWTRFFIHNAEPARNPQPETVEL